MINTELKLSSDVFENTIQNESMRKGFGLGLVQAGEEDKNVVGLCADLAESTQMELFKNKFPERFIEMGVAEQNLVTVASGMAAMGKIPFAASYAVFSPGRNWEQIRTTICYNDLPVKIIGTHAGLNVGPDGGSHQALEDVALARVLPRMTVISPCDFFEAKKAAIAAAKTKNPTYIRLAREKSPIITSEKTLFEIGKAQIVFKKIQTGKKLHTTELDLAIISTGHLLHKALLAAKKLVLEGKSVAVMNLATIKPLDEMAVLSLAHESGAIVTVEDHQVFGGMGSAVSEFLSANYPVPMEFVGVKDQFGQSGTSEELLKAYRLDENAVYSAAKKVLIRK